MMDFGDLRSMVQRKPSPELWASICEAVESWEDVELEAHVLPYLCSHLRRWPAHVRQAPERWWGCFVERYGALPWMAVVATVSRRDQFITEEEVEALGASPWLTSLEVLDLGRSRRMPWNREQLDTEKVRLLTRSPYLERVRSLAMSGHHLRSDALYVLLASHAFHNIHTLDLSFNNFNFLREARLDTSTQHFPHLERVVLRDAGLTFVGLELLARCGVVCAREVDLSENDFGDEGIARWLHIESLEGMRCLELERCGLRPISLQMLSDTAVFQGLTALNLSGNPSLSRGALATLQTSSLRKLELRDMSLEDEGLQALLGAVGPLSHLDLSGNALTDVGVEALVASETFAGLTSLNLSRNALGGPAALALARAPAGLRELSLSGNPMEASALTTLLTSEMCRGLERLSLENMASMNVAAEALSDIQGSSRLERIELRGNVLSRELVRLLVDQPWEIVYDEHMLWDDPYE